MDLDFISIEALCKAAKKFPEIEEITYLGKTDESDYDDYEDIYAWFNVKTNTVKYPVDLGRRIYAEIFYDVDFDGIDIIVFSELYLSRHGETMLVYKKEH